MAELSVLHPTALMLNRAWTERCLCSLAGVSGPMQKTPTQTLRVARGPSDVRPICGWGVGGWGRKRSAYRLCRGMGCRRLA